MNEESRSTFFTEDERDDAERAVRGPEGDGGASARPETRSLAGVAARADLEPGAAPRPAEQPVFTVQDLAVHYGKNLALKGVTMDIKPRRITAIIGPSGCGKSTLIRCFNRMNELIPGAKVSGQVLYHGEDIYAPGIDPVAVRRHIGMVFQRPNPFPKSIYDNIAFGAKINGYKGDMDELVERCLQRAALWDEVKSKLKKSALDLSGGQQQRLCIARAIAVEPDVILMDEPASALDPIATTRIEDLMQELKEDYSIIIVTHNMQQAARVSDFTAFMYLGEAVEFGDTNTIFTNPLKKQTEDYITGRYG